MPPRDLNPITERIVACAQAVRIALGADVSVEEYETALDRAMREDKLQFARQYPFGVPFHGPKDRGFYADFVVEAWILLELKAVEALTSEQTAEARRYLRESGAKLCLLINFGRPEVEVLRLEAASDPPG